MRHAQRLPGRHSDTASPGLPSAGRHMFSTVLGLGEDTRERTTDPESFPSTTQRRPRNAPRCDRVRFDTPETS
ncbi:hypothetical protein NSERUTF1_2420 [Nocardia seriolae]|nr:hypothetical protein NSERUTF1_2420 [Nocardia seriolae]